MEGQGARKEEGVGMLGVQTYHSEGISTSCKLPHR